VKIQCKVRPGARLAYRPDLLGGGVWFQSHGAVQFGERTRVILRGDAAEWSEVKSK
jgi:hypothetical protein